MPAFVVRDLKNTRNGFGLRHCRARHVRRFDVALLIAALSMFLLWLIGLAKKTDNSHFSYQANTLKSPNVLSNFTVGWQTIMRNDFNLLNMQRLWKALTLLSQGENFT